MRDKRRYGEFPCELELEPPGQSRTDVNAVAGTETHTRMVLLGVLSYGQNRASGGERPADTYPEERPVTTPIGGSICIRIERNFPAACR